MIVYKDYTQEWIPQCPWRYPIPLRDPGLLRTSRPGRSVVGKVHAHEEGQGIVGVLHKPAADDRIPPSL